MSYYVNDYMKEQNSSIVSLSRHLSTRLGLRRQAWIKGELPPLFVPIDLGKRFALTSVRVPDLDALATLSMFAAFGRMWLFSFSFFLRHV